MGSMLGPPSCPVVQHGSASDVGNAFCTTRPDAWQVQVLTLEPHSTSPPKDSLAEAGARQLVKVNRTWHNFLPLSWMSLMANTLELNWWWPISGECWISVFCMWMPSSLFTGFSYFHVTHWDVLRGLTQELWREWLAGHLLVPSPDQHETIMHQACPSLSFSF